MGDAFDADYHPINKQIPFSSTFMVRNKTNECAYVGSIRLLQDRLLKVSSSTYIV
jgi:hypothetical protein